MMKLLIIVFFALWLHAIIDNAISDQKNTAIMDEVDDKIQEWESIQYGKEMGMM